MKKIVTLFLICLSTMQVYSQQNTVACGGQAVGSGGSVSYSVGQIDYTDNSSSSGVITQGVQQPYEIYQTTGIKETNIDLSVTTFPLLNNGKVVSCIPNDLMSDKELEENLIKWLEFAKTNGHKTIALTGVRDSSKVEINDINIAKENDNNRVRFIVKILQNWIKNNSSGITEILLIAMSDVYTRN